MDQGFLVDFKLLVQGGKPLILLTLITDQCQSSLVGIQIHFRCSIYRNDKAPLVYDFGVRTSS